MKNWIDKLNPLTALQERMLGTFVRWAVTSLCTYLISAGVVKSEEGPTFIVTVVGIVTPLAWSAWQKYQDKTKFDAARSLPAEASSRAIEAYAKSSRIKSQAWQ